jgi:hypothetical protein
VLSAPVLALPLAALLPLQSPLAVHELGLLVEDQVIVAELPCVIRVGLTVSATVGAAGNTCTDTLSLAEPAALLQLNV